MSDSRLNSIHLEGARRQLFRHAREGLLDARGQQTVYAEKEDSGSGKYPRTVVQGPNAQNVAAVDFWLRDQEECIYPLKIGVNTVGRSEDNDVVLADAYVSRRHCAILVHATSGCELHDIASKNGTFLNGQKLSGPTRLHTGDEIRMCDRSFVFVSKHDASAPVALTQTLHE